MRRMLVLAVAVLAVSTSLAACAATASTAPIGGGHSASRTPSPSASPAVSAISEIELGPQFTRALTSTGTEVWHVDYDSDPASVVARLTTALGDPKVSEYAGAPATDVDLPRTDYDWGGIVLESPHYNGPQPSGDGSSDYLIVVTAPTSHGVEIATSSGVSVGMPDSALAPIASRYTSKPEPSSDDFRYLESWTRSVGGNELTDWIVVTSDSGAVSKIFATGRSYGA